MTVEQAYQTLYGAALIVLLIMIGAMVIRSIIGPRSTDRIMSVNMLGTMTIAEVAILSLLLNEGYLADVAMIYAMISFVAVLMMASMFVPSKPKAPELDRDTPEDPAASEKQAGEQEAAAEQGKTAQEESRTARENSKASQKEREAAGETAFVKGEKNGF